MNAVEENTFVVPAETDYKLVAQCCGDTEGWEIVKDPDAIISLSLNWEQAFNAPNQLLVNSEWDAGGLTLISSAISTDFHSSICRLEGGERNAVYTLKVIAQTYMGLTDVRRIRVKCRER